MDLARAHFQVDVIVGEDARIALGDAAHLERRRNHRRGGRDAFLGHQGRLRIVICVERANTSCAGPLLRAIRVR